MSKAKHGALSLGEPLYTNKVKKTSGLPKVASAGQLALGSSEEILIKHKIKKLSSWYHTWPAWQKRILICTVMNCCTKQQLVVLSTSLEPILHLDFSSSLLPPLQALHLDGVTLFHIQRAVTRKLTQPEVVTAVDSNAYMDSLPSTFFSTHTNRLCKITSYASSISSLHNESSYLMSLGDPPMESAHAMDKTSEKKEPLLPTLPLTHPDHLPTPGVNREASFDQLLGLRQQRFSSVPDFRSTTDLLKKCGRRLGAGESRKGRGLVKSKTIGSNLAGQVQPWQVQRTELFKEQLAQVTSWMEKWRGIYKSYLLSELVKLCDQNLLGYFVQCLHQQLQDKLDINSLPDSVLQQIFHYLAPKDLCRASQVCHQWNTCANLAPLWKSCAYELGVVEGVGNVVEVMETVIRHYKHSLTPASTSQGEKRGMVDWKRVYRDLKKLVLNMKQLVIKSATASESGRSELEERLRGATTRAQARSMLTLLEMLEILRLTCPKSNVTTQQLYHMAPDSASAVRRKIRLEKKAENINEGKKTSSVVLVTDRPRSHKSPVKPHAVLDTWTPTRNLEFAQHLMTCIKEKEPNIDEFLKDYSLFEEDEAMDRGEEFIEKLDIAVDTRPRAPTLPNPDAVTCLILAGGLLSGNTSKPGRILSIPKIRRLENVPTVALCMQCDCRRIVIGNRNRTISVIDLRSGRPVVNLRGHKGSVQCLQFDDYKIVSGSWDTTCIVWDVVHFKILKVLNGHMECVSCLQFDEDILVTGSHDGSLRVWSTSTWDTLSIMSSAHPGGILCLKMNDQIIASGGVDNQVKLWSVSSRQHLKTLQHNAPITALALSHLLLISCSLEGAVILWNLDSFQPIAKMNTSAGAYLKELVPFQSKYYAAGSDGVLYELDVSTGTCLRTLRGHNRIVTAVCVVDHKLVSTSADRTIVTWYFKKPFGSLFQSDEGEGEEEEEGKEVGEEGDRQKQEETGSSVNDSNREVNPKEFHYKPPKYYSDFPKKSIMEDCADCCGFVYYH